MATTWAATCLWWQSLAGWSVRNVAHRYWVKSGRRRFRFGKLTTRNWPRSSWKPTISSGFNMRAVLHIVTKTNDTLAAAVIATQRTQAGAQVNVVDLTVPEPD